MQETSKYTVFNIREYLGDGSHGLGENTLLQVFSEFFLEAADEERRLFFYRSNGFQQSDTRLTDSFKGGRMS